MDKFAEGLSRRIEGDSLAFPVEYLGLFDTVKATKVFGRDIAWPYTRSLPNVRVIRHAVSIDEKRPQFEEYLVKPDPDQQYSWGTTFYGDKGTLKVGVYSYDFIPSGKGEAPVRKDVTYEFEQYPEDKTEKDLETHVAPAVRHHMVDLLAAIDTRRKPVADIEEGYISTASCILANLAMKAGRKFTWDAQKQQIVNDAEGNKMLARAYRKPWTHPDARSV